jgi:hypothetical protein
VSDGRTYWLALDSGWFARSLVVELIADCGGSGVASLLWLMCHAKQQNDGGVVKSGWSAVGRGAGIRPAAAEKAMRCAAELGLLDDFKVLEDGRRFTCRISGWTSDQERGLATFRKSRQRAQKRDMSRGQDRTGEERGLLSQSLARTTVVAHEEERAHAMD